MTGNFRTSKFDKFTERINELDNKAIVDFRIFSHDEFKIWPTNINPLFSNLLNKQLTTLNLEGWGLTTFYASLVLECLQKQEVNFEEIVLDLQDVYQVKKFLLAIENRHTFKFAKILTNRKISKPAEKIACKILETHIYCHLRLNSDIEAISYNSDKLLIRPKLYD